MMDTTGRPRAAGKDRRPGRQARRAHSTSARTPAATGGSPRSTLRSPARPTASPASTSASSPARWARQLPHPRHHHQARPIQELVYNDFYIGENCDVDDRGRLRHPQLRLRRPAATTACTPSMSAKTPTSSTPRSTTARATATGGNIMNPQTIVYLEEGASIQMETVQIRRHRLHQAGHQDRLRQGRGGGGHRAAA